MSAKSAFNRNVENEKFRMFKEIPKAAQSTILLTPTSNAELKCPNAPKKGFISSDGDGNDFIPVCLQIDEDHVPFQLDNSDSNRLLYLKKKVCGEISTPLEISEHCLMPDLDD